MQRAGAGGDNRIHSDISGVIAKVDAQDGQIVPPGGPLVEIVAENEIEVKLGVEAEDLSAAQEGAPITIVAMNDPTAAKVEGTVRLVTRRIDPTTRLVDVYVALPEGTKLLLDGYVRGEIERTEKNALVVPRSAVLPNESREFEVFAVASNRATKHTVKIGAENPNEIQVIADDLHEGDPVVTVGNYELEDGMAVEIKKMSFTAWAHSHARSILFLLVALAIAGAVASLSMPVALFPQVSFPRVRITLDAGDRPAEQMTVEVTTPVEEAVRAIPGVRNLRSTTSRGTAEISVNFNWGEDMVSAMLQCQSQVNRILPSLPSGTSFEVERMDPTVFPVIAYSLTSDSHSLIELRDLALYTLRPALSTVSRCRASRRPRRPCRGVPGHCRSRQIAIVQNDAGRSRQRAVRFECSSRGRPPRAVQQTLSRRFGHAFQKVRPNRAHRAALDS